MNKRAPKKNCWEIMNCGRGPDNENGDVCPAAKETRLNSIHGGINAGRACWVVAGTLCDVGVPSGKFAEKMESCLVCPFYRLVRSEEKEVRPHQELLLRAHKS